VGEQHNVKRCDCGARLTKAQCASAPTVDQDPCPAILPDEITAGGAAVLYFGATRSEDLYGNAPCPTARNLRFGKSCGIGEHHEAKR
jgi:hypothetical protein